MITVNSEVGRIKGSKGNLGDRGTVVEVCEKTNRVRVYWHTYTFPGYSTPKRTWIKIGCVEAVN